MCAPSLAWTTWLEFPNSSGGTGLTSWKCCSAPKLEGRHLLPELTGGVAGGAPSSQPWCTGCRRCVSGPATASLPSSAPQDVAFDPWTLPLILRISKLSTYSSNLALLFYTIQVGKFYSSNPSLLASAASLRSLTALWVSLVSQPDFQRKTANSNKTEIHPVFSLYLNIHVWDSLCSYVPAHTPKRTASLGVHRWVCQMGSKSGITSCMGLHFHNTMHQRLLKEEVNGQFKARCR